MYTCWRRTLLYTHTHTHTHTPTHTHTHTHTQCFYDNSLQICVIRLSTVIPKSKDNTHPHTSSNGKEYMVDITSTRQATIPPERTNFRKRGNVGNKLGIVPVQKALATHCAKVETNTNNRTYNDNNKQHSVSVVLKVQKYDNRWGWLYIYM